MSIKFLKMLAWEWRWRGRRWHDGPMKRKAREHERRKIYGG